MRTCKTCGTEVPDNAVSCPTCGGPVGEPVFGADGTPSPAAGGAQATAAQPKKGGKAFKIVVAILVIWIVLSAFGSCSRSCSEHASSTQEDWPTGPLAQMIPSMDRKCESVTESKESLYIRVSDRIEKKDFDSYVDKCEERGFTVDADEDGDGYIAYDSEGYKLSVQYSSYSKEITIDLDAPKVNGELVWPTMGLATTLPDPHKAKGSIAVDSASQFTAYVGEMDKAAYDAYVAQCIEKGFDVDYSRGDTSFNAENGQGDSLHLEYQGFNTMYVSLYAPKESSASSAASSASPEAAADPALAPEPAPAASQADAPAASDASFRQAMDDYEKFMDGYIAFMEKYNSSSNPAGMAADYAKLMADYAAMTAKVEAIDEDSLTAEDYQYYTEVMARVSEKLAGASLG